MQWPDNKAFAFTIFDDTDSFVLPHGGRAYSFLADHGFRTTKSVWPTTGPGNPSDPGQACDDPHYRSWVSGLRDQGFEIGYHMACSHTSTREETIAALDRFAEYFGGDPAVMANHHYSREGIYFGESRVTGWNRLLYNAATRFRNRNKYQGHIPASTLFWGDICRDRIKYVRNFVFANTNTLKACPFMPYFDPLRPFVQHWFAASEGANPARFNRCISEANQDRLEEEGGACIMYTHLGLFAQDGKVDTTFEKLMRRLSRKNGWFVPVRTLLDHMLAASGGHIITDAERRRLERKWVLEKLLWGTG